MRKSLLLVATAMSLLAITTAASASMCVDLNGRADGADGWYAVNHCDGDVTVVVWGRYGMDWLNLRDGQSGLWDTKVEGKYKVCQGFNHTNC